MRRRRTVVRRARSASAVPATDRRKVADRPHPTLGLHPASHTCGIWRRVLILHESGALQPHDAVPVRADEVGGQKPSTWGVGPRLPTRHVPTQAERRAVAVAPIAAHEHVTLALAELVHPLQPGCPQCGSSIVI
jgi:hypothetical protein